MTTSLFELIEHADAIEIDDYFFRYFNMEDDAENEDDVALQVMEDDTVFYFTVSDLEHAVYDPELKQWAITGMGDEEVYTITLYSVKPISVIG